MKFDLNEDDITAAVRENDALTDVVEDHENPIGLLADTLGVDGDALTHVAMTRSMIMLAGIPRLPNGLDETILGEVYNVASASSAWLDGFFAALHAVEQKLVAGELKT